MCNFYYLENVIDLGIYVYGRRLAFFLHGHLEEGKVTTLSGGSADATTTTVKRELLFPEGRYRREGCSVAVNLYTLGAGYYVLDAVSDSEAKA